MDISDFLGINGNVSSTRTTEKYILKHFPKEYNEIKEHTQNIGLIADRFSEELFHYLNNITSAVLCKKCKTKKSKFNGLLNGYLDYCSLKCSNSSQNVIGKKEKTYLKKYGVKNPSQSVEIKNKIADTFNLKYGGNPFSVEKFKDKIKTTNKIKYGTEHPMSKNSKLWESLTEEKIKGLIEKYKKLSIIDIEPDKHGNALIYCDICNSNFTISKWNLHQRTKQNIESNPCTNCFPLGHSNKSIIEDFIKNLLEENNIIYERNNRTILDGKEIDFLLIDYKIGIEVNGNYWHSDKFKGPSYHRDKTILARDKNYLLLHIFEDEIILKPEIVKSRILSILNKNTKRIFARQCKIKEIDSVTCNNFLRENHLQGPAGAKRKYGLFHDECLVSVMTFGELRKNMGNVKKDGYWELIRFCNLAGFNIIGGASKLIKRFKADNNPIRIITYCDARWSNGEFYEKLGFILDKHTQSNYWYLKSNNIARIHRFKYRKDQLIKAGHNPNKTESQIMNELGYLRIYDSGNFRFFM